MDWVEWTWLVAVRLHMRWQSFLCARATAQSTVEYALVGALVVIAAAGALTVLGGQLSSVFSNISKMLGTAAAH